MSVASFSDKSLNHRAPVLRRDTLAFERPLVGNGTTRRDLSQVKFGPIPESLLEQLALGMGRIPIPMIDVLFGPMKARAIMAGLRLGIFDALRSEPSTVTELSESLHLDEPCLEVLLRALVHCDYLVLKRERFSLSRLSRCTMIPGASMEARGFAG